MPAVPGELDDLFASSVGWTCSPRSAETADGGNCNGFNLNTIRVPTADGVPVSSWGQQLEVNWLAAPVQRGVLAGQVVVGNSHPSQSAQRANASVDFHFDNGYQFPAPPLVLVTVHNELGSDHPDVFAASVSRVTAAGFRVNIARLDVADAGWGQDVMVNWMVVPENPALLFGRQAIGPSSGARFLDIRVPVTGRAAAEAENRYVVSVESEPSKDWFDVFTATVLSTDATGFDVRVARVDNCVEAGLDHPCGWGQEATLVWMALPQEYGFADMRDIYTPGYDPSAHNAAGGTSVAGGAWAAVVIVIALIIIVGALIAVGVVGVLIFKSSVLPALQARQNAQAATLQGTEGLMAGFAEEGTLGFFDDNSSGIGGMEASETSFAVMDDGDVL